MFITPTSSLIVHLFPECRTLKTCGYRGFFIVHRSYFIVLFHPSSISIARPQQLLQQRWRNDEPHLVGDAFEFDGSEKFDVARVGDDLRDGTATMRRRVEKDRGLGAAVGEARAGG